MVVRSDLRLSRVPLPPSSLSPGEFGAGTPRTGPPGRPSRMPIQQVQRPDRVLPRASEVPTGMRTTEVLRCIHAGGRNTT